jgi:urease accessory protein
VRLLSSFLLLLFSKRYLSALWVGAFMSALATSAQAHSGTGLVGGIQAGLLHPLSGPDHMLAMVSVGLWGAILGRPLVVVLPVVFPTMMAIGGVLGILGVLVPPVEIGIAASVIILGSVIGFALKPPAIFAVLLVAIFALFHGYAHGQELPSAADPVGYSVGFVLATGALHLAGIGLGFVVLHRAGLKALRAIGAGIAMIGLWFLLQTNLFTHSSVPVL